MNNYLAGKYRPILEASVVGLVLGFADANYAGDGGFSDSAYFLGGFLIGLIHAGRCLPCWPILGVSLYGVHVVAIAFGIKPPYVEENYRFAEQCLLAFVPSGSWPVPAFVFSSPRSTRFTASMAPPFASCRGRRGISSYWWPASGSDWDA